MSTKVFKVSSALKNIIGKELITDDFIAVFELVKNSFDAGATQVHVSFEDLDTSNPKLIIEDDGKGMSQDDLDNKWLFVAYSSKRDDNASGGYRDEIQKRRIYAGAKGIGRFSCDKLGATLRITTRKDDEDTAHQLSIKWEDFEADSTKEIAEIPIEYEEIAPRQLLRGTKLEIGELREGWDREKLIKLKRSLEKLINPSQGNDSANFAIFLHAPSELEADSSVSPDEPWRIVNGRINNFLFENLGLKSISIVLSIPSDGEFMFTRLEDRGVLIYEIKEKNPLIYADKRLRDVSITLFNLNTTAKQYFTRYMGVRPSVFGSVLLYKNGFRVHPFGEWGDDGFGIDSRKTQGFARFLGTRDLIGRVEINNNPDFQEASSRDGGLIKNEAYFSLRQMFIQYALKRLERYAVEIVKFGNFSDNFQEHYQSNADIGTKILSLIEDISQSEDIVDIRYDPNVVDILNELSEKSLQNLLSNFERIATENDNSQLAAEARKAKKRLNEINKARAEAEAEAEAERQARLKAESQIVYEAERARGAEAQARQEADRALRAENEYRIAEIAVEQKTTQNLFLQSVVSQDLSNIISLHHHIGIAAGTIENYVKNLTKRIATGKPLTSEVILDALGKINEQARKIGTTVKFATKANFNLEAATISADLCEYISEYLMNVCNGIILTKNNKDKIKFSWNNTQGCNFIFDFRPLEVAIVIDNLVSNSRKASAKAITLSVSACDGSQLEILYVDDGEGIPKSRADKIFDFGFTTTEGSGLGLSHVRTLLGQMNATIDVDLTHSSGAHFVLRFQK